MSILTVYSPAGWAAMRRLADDRAAFPDFKTMDRASREIIAREPVAQLVLGPRAARVVDAWCRAEHGRNDETSRVAFIIALKAFLDETEGTA